MMNYPESISAEELGELDFVSFDGPIEVITQIDESFAEAIDYLSSQELIGFDTETKPCFLPNQPRRREALLQLAGPDKAFLFRLHILGLPAPLARLMSNPHILKIGAAVTDDIRGLQAYTKFVPKGFVDLQTMAAEYGIKEKSVKKLSAIIMGKRVSKSQQLSNWEAPQLSGAQLKYAAIDAWICREMYLELCHHEKGSITIE